MDSRRTPIIATLAALAILAVAAPAALADNLLANPGFEAGGGSYDGWTTFGSGVQLSLAGGDDDIYRSGSAAAKIYGEFTSCDPGTGVFTVGGFFQAFTPAVGKLYTFKGWSFVSSGDPIPGTDPCNANRAIAKIVFYDDPTLGGSAHEICSNEIIIGDGNTPLDQWNEFSIALPAPEGALRVEALILYLQPACDPGAVFVDDLSLLEFVQPAQDNLLANPSFDTDLSGWETFGNVYYDGRSFARRTPPGSAKLFSTFTPDSDSGLFQSFAVAPDEFCLFGVHVMTTCVESPINGANDNALVGTIIFRDAEGTEIGLVDKVLLDNTAPLGTWVWQQLSGTAPAGTATADVYVLFVSPTQQGGAAWIDDAVFNHTGYTGVEGGSTPAAARLLQNVPNPFNPLTRIAFVLERPGPVEITVYDVAGRRVATLLRDRLEAGAHDVTWNGRTDRGAMAPAGSYRYVLRTDGGTQSRSMVLLK